METEGVMNVIQAIMGQLGHQPSFPKATTFHPLPTAQKRKWNHAYLVREVRGEGLGREPREEASGASSHCSSCSISSSSVRPPAGGGRGSRVRGKTRVKGQGTKIMCKD